MSFDVIQISVNSAPVAIFKRTCAIRDFEGIQSDPVRTRARNMLIIPSRVEHVMNHKIGASQTRAPNARQCTHQCIHPFTCLRQKAFRRKTTSRAFVRGLGLKCADMKNSSNCFSRSLARQTAAR